MPKGDDNEHLQSLTLKATEMTNGNMENSWPPGIATIFCKIIFLEIQGFHGILQNPSTTKNKKKNDLEQVEQNKSIGRKCSESYVFLRLPLLYDDGWLTSAL